MKQTILGLPVEEVSMSEMNDVNLESWSAYMAEKKTFSLNGKPMSEKNGILLVEDPPKPAEKKEPSHPINELQKESARKEAYESLWKLWRACELDQSDRVVLPDGSFERKKLHRDLWRLMAKTLLGDAAPGEEVKT